MSTKRHPYELRLNGRKIIKFKIAIASIGIMLLGVVLWQFILFDFTAGKRSAGTVGFGLIICVLIYGYVYRNFKSLKNTEAIIIFYGFNIIQAVSVGFIFLLTTVMFTIFLTHFIILMIGFALITFAVYYGMNVVIFDYASRTVEGLFESEKTVAFEKIQIEFQNEEQIQLIVSDSGKKLMLKRGLFTAFSWGAIIENLNRVTHNQ